MKYIITISEKQYEKIKKLYDYGFGTQSDSIILEGTPYEEQPHGEWITKKDSFQTFCSHCNKAIPYSDEYDFSDFIFCPYCNADMRKKSPCDHCIDDSDCDRCDVPLERR